MQDSSAIPSYLSSSLSIGASDPVDRFWSLSVPDAVAADTGYYGIKIDCSLVNYPKATFTGVSELSQNLSIKVYDLTILVADQHDIINGQ